MWQMLLLLAVSVTAVAARPSPGGLDVEPGSLQPYQYQYEVNVPETGDQKSHTEERDETGVVVGNYQVVDPNGDLRKLFYRVEGNSGFVITDQQVMRGFAPPPPAPETYSRRQTTQEGGGSGGQLGLVSDGLAGVSQQDNGGAGANQQLAFSGQQSVGDAGQFSDAAGSSSENAAGDEFGGGFVGFNAFTSSSGSSGFSDEGIFSSAESGDTFGVDSFEGGSFGGGSSGESSSSSSSEGGQSGGQQPFTSGVTNTDGQGTQTTSSPPPIPPISPVSAVPTVKPFEFHGPAFTFSIRRTEPNRFDVKEKIIGHEVEFNTHGGRAPGFQGKK